MSENYQGFTNRESWAAKLHMDNDEGLYNEYREKVVELKFDVYETEIWLKEWFDKMEDNVLGNSSRELRLMILDIGSLWRVDWREIAESIVEDGLDELEVEGDIEVRMDTYISPKIHDSGVAYSFSGSAEKIVEQVEKEIQLSKFSMQPFGSGDDQINLDWGGVTLVIIPQDMMGDEQMLFLLKLNHLLQKKCSKD